MSWKCIAICIGRVNEKGIGWIIVGQTLYECECEMLQSESKHGRLQYHRWKLLQIFKVHTVCIVYLIYISAYHSKVIMVVCRIRLKLTDEL